MRVKMPLMEEDRQQVPIISTTKEKNKIRDAVNFAIEWGPRIILFILLFLIVSFGTHKALFFLSNSWGTYDEYGDFTSKKFELSWMVGLAIVGFCFHLYYSLKKKNKSYKTALQILKKQAKFNLFEPIGPLVAGDDASLLIENWNEKWARALELEEVKGALESLGDLEDYRNLHDNLQELDKIILENIQDCIKEKFPKEVYYLRLHILDDYIETGLSGKILRYEKAEPGGEMIFEFCKMVLNIFYSKYKDYEKQKVKFDKKLFREYFFQKAEDDDSYSLYSTE